METLPQIITMTQTEFDICIILAFLGGYIIGGMLGLLCRRK